MTGASAPGGERQGPDPRIAGRGAVGVVGRFELGPMSDALRASRLTWYPLLGVTALGGIDGLFAAALVAAGGSISLTLGVPNLSLLVAVRAVGLAIGGLATLRVSGRGRRTPLVVTGGAMAVAALAAGGFARGAWALAGAASLAGLGTGVVQATHRPLLFDYYRPEIRVRSLAAYTAGLMLAVAGASGGTAVADALGLTWRAVFSILAGAAAVVVLAGARLREPVEASWETRVISSLVHRSVGPPGAAPPGPNLGPDTALTAGQRFRQILAMAAARPLLLVASAFGLLLVTIPRYLPVFWQASWRIGPDAELGLYSSLCLASVGGLWWFGRRGEVAFRATPNRMLRLTARVTCLAALCLALAFEVRSFPLMVVLLAIAFWCLAASLPAASVALLTIVRPPSRPHASVALGLAVLLGGLGGNFLVQAFAARYGLKWAFLVAAMSLLGIAAAAIQAARAVEVDLDETVGALIEEHELRTRASQGQHLPLLTLRHIEFSYGPVQVLFDVDFTVDDGEMVALLGTNGAGKSTLLRLISGIGLPSRGSVRLHGSDITHLGPDDRVRLGISQVPGGRAVFRNMSVVENLRVFGYSHGRDRGAVNSGIEASLAAFPSLAARADQRAGTLSGGEQQMLGLAKAFVAPPRLLLIDELSLGLAPIVVGQLLEAVRQLNADGMAVVIVEQSVNIALTLVHHAYFMEKGEIRFDGRAGDLARRPDLLRSVFLEGAAASRRMTDPRSVEARRGEAVR